MARMVVLGGGMVGSAMAMDLSRHGHDTLLVDRDVTALEQSADRWSISTLGADLSDPEELCEVTEHADVVLGALPSRLGRATLQRMVELGRRYVDISFMAEDPRELSERAQETGAVVVYDCGVAPGMSNVLAGRAAAALPGCERIAIYVGGLPVARQLPFQYKAPFAPWDVLEEYTRPARIVEHGRIVVREALSELEPIEFDGLGTLEAFNSDGLRSLVDLPIPHMIEKTLRYPGHVELMKAMREAGLFGLDPVEVGGQRVVPRELTAAVLFPRWTFEEGEPDLTVMRIQAWSADGRSWRWDLDDRYDPETGVRSMSRVTAFPATIVAGMVADGTFTEAGVHAPERLGSDEALTRRLLAELGERGVTYRFTDHAAAS